MKQIENKIYKSSRIKYNISNRKLLDVLKKKKLDRDKRRKFGPEVQLRN